MSCDWEGNRRSGDALTMRHRLKWFIHLRAQGLSKGDERPTNTLHGAWYSLPLCNRSTLGGPDTRTPCLPPRLTLEYHYADSTGRFPQRRWQQCAQECQKPQRQVIINLRLHSRQSRVGHLNQKAWLRHWLRQWLRLNDISWQPNTCTWPTVLCCLINCLIDWLTDWLKSKHQRQHICDKTLMNAAAVPRIPLG